MVVHLIKRFGQIHSTDVHCTAQCHSDIGQIVYYRS